MGGEGSVSVFDGVCSGGKQRADVFVILVDRVDSDAFVAPCCLVFARR